MVTQADLTPTMVVVAVSGSQARRGEHVVEPVPGFAPGTGVKDPAHVATVVAVQ